MQSPVDPFAVQCADNPVLRVGDQIPSWLFGAVAVSADSGSVEVGTACAVLHGSMYEVTPYSPRVFESVPRLCRVEAKLCRT